MKIIETENLTKQYDGLVAVDNLNLAIEEGEIFGLLGPNGAGKSTTLLTLTTILKPTSGTATVNGFDIVRQPSHVRKSIGPVFQDPSSDDTLTGYENLKLHGMLYSMPVSLREERIAETKGSLVSLTVVNANEHLPEILAKIGKVDSVEIHSPTLNDVFLHFTGREIREESPEGGWGQRAMNHRANK